MDRFEEAAVDRFGRRAAISDEEFAGRCFDAPGPVEIAACSVVRHVAATLGKVGHEHIYADDRFKIELRDLPFWSDYCNHRFRSLLEDESGFELDESQAEQIPHPEFHGNEYNVGRLTTFFRNVLRPDQEQILLKRGA